jgi:hypothetical protein
MTRFKALPRWQVSPCEADDSCVGQRLCGHARRNRSRITTQNPYDRVFFSGHASINVLDSGISSSGRSTRMQIFLYEACRLHVRDESFMHAAQPSDAVGLLLMSDEN